MCSCTKGFEFNNNKTTCIRKKTREEVMAEGNQRCRQTFGQQAYAVKPKGDGTFECQCSNGYKWNGNRTACIRIPTVADGHQVCRNKFGPQAHAVRVNPDDTFQCQCSNGYKWNGNQTACVRIPTVADGHQVCRNNFGPQTHAVRVNPDDTFQCQCDTGYDMVNGRCVRVTAEDGHAACRRQNGPNSYATSYNGNGSWNCFTPPQAQPPPPRTSIWQGPCPRKDMCLLDSRIGMFGQGGNCRKSAPGCNNDLCGTPGCP